MSSKHLSLHYHVVSERKTTSRASVVAGVSPARSHDCSRHGRLYRDNGINPEGVRGWRTLRLAQRPAGAGCFLWQLTGGSHHRLMSQHPSGTGCCARARGTRERARSQSFYPPARIALNVPCFDGLSPTSGENSTSPVIRSGFSNFPLKTNVPASRPTLPSKNSTGPENVTELSSLRVHFASEGVADPQTLALGSTSSKVPFPPS
jgi:hypothetical protein